jgi:hypothetical protein
MRLIVIGTDHRLQQAIVQDERAKTWVPRSGGRRYRRLVAYCIEKLGAKAILEETHIDQDRIAPTIGSIIAKERGLVWQCLGLGEPGLSDFLSDPPLVQAIDSGVRPDLLAGIYALNEQKVRERFMYTTIMHSMREHDCVLAVVGFIHLAVLARMFEAEHIAVTALMFTYPLVVDEARS